MQGINNENNDMIDIIMPSKAEYVGVVRLTISAIANRMGFDIEEIEDIKVSVSEACTNAIKHSRCDFFSMNVSVLSDKLVINISDKGEGYDTEDIEEPNLENPNEEGGLGIYIIKTLMDQVELGSKKGEGSFIRMIKYLGEENA